ncbi:non-homologous end-joining DNA ligase [Streptomyces sp. TLI_105]|uniref:non-homologous end-joining DNA ligase n=1 Tax=Streptomyces sp. TLI_105 TaxID=1881019 RepID=UPI0008980CC8|nr:non-homologous end-joining DNA ligase [Streptomyces sp. TLI_105]SEB90483.1 bifunctional non-homologous end joining protein LigD [Streptomyces sp. TLI_105]
MTTTDIRVSGRTVEIRRAEKELFPDDGITKADLADYYRRVGPRILPHLRGRPLMLERHPDGIGAGRFMQKDTPDYFPDWIHRWELPKADGTVTYPVCDDVATLLYLAGQACITPHRWLSKADRPDHPDRLVFDLDPSGEDFEPVRQAAASLHEVLDELDLPAALMTTGSRGLHVLVPLDRRATFDTVRAFARDVAEVIADRHPEQFTTAARKQGRKGRLYLDVQRNAYGQTAVTPYAVRALPGAPVATPLSWSELDDPDLTPRRWTLATLDERLEIDDPWKQELRRGRSMEAARTRLEKL